MIAEVDGEQVFTVGAMMELMQAQSRRIERAKQIALIALAGAALDLALLAAIVIRFLG